MYAIAGAAGNTGAVVADTLLDQGRPVRVIVRTAAAGEPWRARGAEVAVADLGDDQALTGALAGVAGAYLLVPPRMAATDPVAENTAIVAALRRAVTAAKVPHVVLLSAIGAQHGAGNGPFRWLHLAERELAATGAALTSIRAAYFQENWGASLGMLRDGVLLTFLPPASALPMVATPDIGRAAAAALIEGGRSRQVIELAGPREIGPAEVAAAYERITGRSVRTIAAPLHAVVPTFARFGASPQLAALFREFYEGLASGVVAWEGTGARAVRGSVTIDDTLRRLLAKEAGA